MSDAPDFITATFDNWRNQNAGSAYRNNAGKTRYVRRAPAVLAELPEVKALIAAAGEGAARECKLRRDLLIMQNVVTPENCEIADYDICEEAIRDSIPADAKAALDRMLQEAEQRGRNKALREAADGCRKRAEQVANAVLTGLPEQARLREAMDAAHSKDFHCILALIQEAPHDPA